MALNFEVEEIKGHLKKEIAINLKDIEKFRFKRLFNILLIFLLFFSFYDACQRKQKYFFIITQIST